MSDFSSRCRSCLSEEATFNLFDNENLFLRKMLMDCACLQVVEGNNIPSSICKYCQLFLVQFDEFRTRCKQVDAILLENLQNNSTGDHDYSNLNRPPADEALDSQSTTLSPLQQPTTSESCVRKLNRKYKKRLYRKSRIIKEDNRMVPTDVFNLNNNCTIIDKERSEPTIKELHFADRSDAGMPKIQKKKHRLSSYLCSECGYRALDRSTLSVHVRKHTGERPYACSVCAKQFTSSSNVRAHERTHGAAAARFVCELCGARLSSGTALRRHAARHDVAGARHQCQRCRRLFTTRDNLRQHIKIHAGVKNQVCDECGARFLRGTDLRVHGRVHARAKVAAATAAGGGGNVMPRRRRDPALGSQAAAHKVKEQERRRALAGSQHACKDCGKVFVRRAGLISHMKRKKPCVAENNAIGNLNGLNTDKIDNTIAMIVNKDSDNNQLSHIDNVEPYTSITTNNFGDRTNSSSELVKNKNDPKTNNLSTDFNGMNRFELNSLTPNLNQKANENSSENFEINEFEQKPLTPNPNPLMSQDVGNCSFGVYSHKKTNTTICIQDFYRKTFGCNSVVFNSKVGEAKSGNFSQGQPLLSGETCHVLDLD